MTVINPTYNHQPRKLKKLDQYLEGIKNSDFGVLSELFSLAESTRADHAQLISNILKQFDASHNSKRIAITGSPGAGKSTILNTVISQMASDNIKIAVLAIDPSSELSKGSILGDKTRMDKLVSFSNVLIRPIASSGALGGIAASTYKNILLLEAAKFDFIFIETVGVGQSSFEVSKLTDLFTLVISPAMGDELQGIKRGIVEMADIILVNKTDGQLTNLARETASAYSKAISLNSYNNQNWKPKVINCSALESLGITAFIDTLNQYFSEEQRSVITSNRAKQNVYWFEKEIQQYLMNKFFAQKHISQKFELSREHILNGDSNLFLELEKIIVDKEDV